MDYLGNTELLTMPKTAFLASADQGTLIVTNDISPTIFHFGTEAMTALWTIDGAREAFLRGQQLAALLV
jgi:hypothetical protein